MSNNMLDQLVSDVVSTPTPTPTKGKGKGKGKGTPKPEYDVMIGDVGYSHCAKPGCNKLHKGAKGTMGKLCALALPRHHIELQSVPAGYGKTATMHTCKGGKDVVSAFVKAFGNDGVVHCPIHYAIYPVKVVGDKARYVPTYWFTPAGIKAIATHDYAHIPASVLASVPEVVKTTWQVWHDSLGEKGQALMLVILALASVTVFGLGLLAVLDRASAFILAMLK